MNLLQNFDFGISNFGTGKVHGSLARAGKVRGQTPKVAKQDKKKKPRGRAHKRMQYNRRFVTAGTPLFVGSPYMLDFLVNRLIYHKIFKHIGLL